MIKTRQTLMDAISSFKTTFPEEEDMRGEFLKLLANPDCFQRTHLPGHITGSAWIVNTDMTKALLVLHAKLGRWLQPGGHADGEEDVLRVALREAWEETGVKAFTRIVPAVFDLDVHPIPERKDFPAHLHYDVRFFVQADEATTLLISDESTDLSWIELSTLGTLTGNNPSIMRMVDKTHQLRQSLS